MLHYANDHALRTPFNEVLASIERFLELAGVASRPPIEASIRIANAVPGRVDQRMVEAQSMRLKRGHAFQPRVDAIVERIRAHRDDPRCTFGVRWVPDFQGPSTSSFEVLGIDGEARQDGGGFAHYIQLSGRDVRSTAPNYAMLQLVLPFEHGSEAFHGFVEAAEAVLCFRFSPGAFRQLSRANDGRLKASRLPVSGNPAGAASIERE